MQKLLTFLFVFTFLISFSSAAIQVGIDGSLDEIGINFDGTPFNISTQTVNVSEYWNTNIGSLGEVNSTQFENSGGQLHLLDSWLTTFINAFGFLTGNIFDQSLNTTDNVTFNNVTINNNLSVNTNTLFVDSSNNRVGIGTTNPSATLDVNGSINGEMYYDAIVDASGKGKYTTVNQATAGESEGASIFIRNGNYTENTNIVLKNGQKLVGESREGVVIDLNGSYQLKAVGASATHFTGILLDSFSITGATTIGTEQVYFLYVDKSTIRNVRSYWETNSGRPRAFKLYWSNYNLLDNVIAENGHSNFYIVDSNYNKIISSSSFTPAFENYNIQRSAYNTFVGNLAKGSGVGVYMRYTSDNNQFISMTFDGVSNAIALYNSPQKTFLSGIIAVGISGSPIFEGLGTATSLFLENSYLEGDVNIYGDNFHIVNTQITGDLFINGSANETQITNSNFNSITNSGTNTKLINNKASGLTNYISDIGNIGINTTSPSNALNIVGSTNSTTGFIVGGNVGITGNYTNGNCWTAYSGGIVYATNCSLA